MTKPPRNEFRVAPEYQPLMRAAGLDAEAVFDHPHIVAWRTLPDRDNCTLDVDVEGKNVRLHIKRYKPAPGEKTPADEEANAIQVLYAEQIPTLKLVGWGKLADGRSFIITEDLAGYRAADKLIEAGTKTFEELLEPTADLAAKLHKAGLHHRDLYLCHFFVRENGDLDIRLIDAARVARLGGFLTRGRWILKDLSQFWYSTTPPALGVSEEQRERWLRRYQDQAGLAPTHRLRQRIRSKVKSIARHDAKLKKSQPTRNISIPK